jgi:predicted PurR-regulated permease PerM
MPSVERQTAFWLGVAALLALFLYVFSSVLLPFVAGFTLAYLLDPLADRLEKWGLNRLVASLLILICAVVASFVLGLALLPRLVAQLGDFIERLPTYFNAAREIIQTRVEPIFARFDQQVEPKQLQDSLGPLIGKLSSLFGNMLSSLVSGGQALLDIASLLVITPVVAFYMLVDWDRMIASIDGFVPPRHRETVRTLAREINRAIGGFIRGQALVCLFLGTWYAVGLTLCGLNYGVLIGVIAGALTVIPYVGSLTGLFLAAGVALGQFWPDYLQIILVLAVFFSGQFLEGNILSPKLVGNAVGLHPVWLMFALLAAGSLFGFVGLLIAVPIAATIGVLSRFALSRYMQSPLYLGAPSNTPSLPKPDR